MSGFDVITPEWPAPPAVKALVTTRRGGISEAPFDTFNLGLHVGDNPDDVLENRQRLQRLLGIQDHPQWLAQVHGSDAIEAQADGVVREADACFTSKPGVPCSVMTADCLPVLFCTLDGAKVAAAHAGWRGLAGGVLEATLEKLQVPASGVMAWLGPAIGPEQFEVGPEVREAFMAPLPESAKAFKPNPSKLNHWYADLYLLARQRLKLAGVERVYGGGCCTFTESDRFFSFRRDGVTGRMASLIWISE